MTSDKFVGVGRGIIVKKRNLTKQDLWEAAEERKARGAFPHSTGADDDVITRILEILPNRGTTARGKFDKTTVRGGEKRVGEGELPGKNFIHAGEDSWKLFKQTGLHKNNFLWINVAIIHWINDHRR